MNKVAIGQVWLAGAGPGDPDLLTMKALKAMQSADVIVFDALVSEPIMALCNPNAERISVGKKAGNHSLPQDKINQLLVDIALSGKSVCRLKGGDPYIFGRGGEEAQLLASNKIPFEVIPGITAAAACSASSGIPLTHRGYAQSVQFVTGHCKNTQGLASASPSVDWQTLALSKQTLVIYMGILRSEDIRRQLMLYGRAAETPVAIVENGTRPNQRVVTGSLSELDQLVKQNQIGSPALIIVGEVVQLYKELNPELQRAWLINTTAEQAA